MAVRFRERIPRVQPDVPGHGGRGVHECYPLSADVTSAADPRHSMIGFALPTTFVPSGFSISIHHIASAGSGSGAMA